MEERPTKYFRDERDVLEKIREVAGIAEISDEAISISDLDFFRNGEFRFDDVNKKLYIRVNEQLHVFSASAVTVEASTSSSSGGSTTVTEQSKSDYAVIAGLNTILMDYSFADTLYDVIVQVFNSGGTGIVAYGKPKNKTVNSFQISVTMAGLLTFYAKKR